MRFEQNINSEIKCNFRHTFQLQENVSSTLFRLLKEDVCLKHLNPTAGATLNVFEISFN